MPIPNEYNSFLAGALGGVNTYLDRMKQEEDKSEASHLADQIIGMHQRYLINLDANNKMLLGAQAPSANELDKGTAPFTTPTEFKPYNTDDDLRKIYKKRAKLSMNPYGEHYNAYLNKIMADPEYQFFQTQDGVLAVDKQHPMINAEIYKNIYRPTYNDRINERYTDNGDGTYSRIVTYRDLNSNEQQDYTMPATFEEYNMWYENLWSKRDQMEQQYQYDADLANLKAKLYGGFNRGYGNNYVEQNSKIKDLLADIDKFTKLQMSYQANGGKWYDASSWANHDQLKRELAYQFGVDLSQPNADALLDNKLNTYRELGRRERISEASQEPVPPVDVNNKSISIGESYIRSHGSQADIDKYLSLTAEQKAQALMKIMQKIKEAKAE